MKPSHRRILDVLTAEPGVTYRQLARRADLPLATTYDSVVALHRLGLLDYGKCPTCGHGILIPLKGDSDGR